MNYFKNLKAQADAEQAAQIEATKNETDEEYGPILLDFYSGVATLTAGAEKVSEKMPLENRSAHIDKWIARADATARERKVQLIVQDCGSAVMSECKDYR